jgi:predicted TIM-barrel fold metal-dependent hydrolase
MIVDAHVHVNGDPGWGSPTMRQGFGRIWPRLVGWTGDRATLDHSTASRSAAIDPTGERCVAEMDEAGIDASVMMPIDAGVRFDDVEWSIEAINEASAELARRHPGRLYSFLGVDPRRRNALELFRRGILEWGMKGLKLYPPMGFYPSDECCRPLYEAAIDLGVPVLGHCGLGSPPLKSRFAHPLAFEDAAADYPELQLILAHAGMAHAWLDEAIMVAIYKPNVYLDPSTWQAWLTEEEFVRTIAFIRDRVGIHRLLFASDRFGIGPAIPQREWVGQFRRLPEVGPRYGVEFTPGEIDLVLGGNAVKLMRLDELSAVGQRPPGGRRSTTGNTERPSI